LIVFSFSSKNVERRRRIEVVFDEFLAFCGDDDDVLDAGQRILTNIEFAA